MRESYKNVIYRYQKDLLRLEHVVGVGYGLKERRSKKTGARAIVVLVDRKVPLQQLNKKDVVPQRMEDYWTDVKEVGDIQFLEDRTARMRPARPGVSIGHYKISAGTFGAVVKDKKTGKPLILSNNHVLANITDGRDDRARVGDLILQPGTYDGGTESKDAIGKLERFVPIRKSDGEAPGCPTAIAMENLLNSFLHFVRPDYNFKLLKKTPENLVDCAVASPIDEETIDDNILELGEVKGIKDPEIEMKIRKSGRTSGITGGKIQAINATVQVKMSQKDVAIFADQFITDPLSRPGDSGSLVIDEENNAVGLLFAGSEKATVCNWIRNVLDVLEIEF